MGSKEPWHRTCNESSIQKLVWNDAMKVIFTAAILSLIAGWAGCKVRSNPSDTSAVITKLQKNQALKALRSIDYLPYAYTQSGCFMRSYLSSLELASLGIPSSALYVWNDSMSLNIPWRKDEGGKPDKKEFVYHTALLIKEKKEETSIVYDPLVDAQKPHTLSEWLSKLLKKGTKKYYYHLNQGSEYFNEIFDSSPNPAKKLTPVGKEPEVKMIRSIKDMKKFNIESISNACKVAAGQWRSIMSTRTYQKNPEYPKGPFKENPCKLRSRIHELISKVQKRQLLAGDPKNFSCFGLDEMEEEWLCNKIR